MKTAGIIAECNPLHDGHRYLIRKAREVSGADHVIAVISGDFVQRGEPAILSKEIRCAALLDAGVDLVLELPVYYACAGAEYFARGGVSLLASLGVVTDLCFGSESGNTASILQTARILSEESGEFSRLLRQNLSKGATFAAAYSAACNAVYSGAPVSESAGSSDSAASDSIIADGSPNDLLGCLYVKTLLNKGFSIMPHAIHRISAGSASSLREQMHKDQSYISFDTFSMPLEYKLRELAAHPESFRDYLDVSDDLANRILNELPKFESANQFRTLLKTRNYTYTGISRALLHILLNIRTSEMNSFSTAGCAGYARILGFRREASTLLHEIKKNSSVPLISKLAGAEELITDPFKNMFRADLSASELYDMGCRYPGASLSQFPSGTGLHSEMIKNVLIR